MSEDRLSPQARQALGQAEAIARRLRHRFVNTEHLLLGIVVAEDGLASRVLLDVGLDPATAENYVRLLYPSYPSANEGQQIFYANGVERALFLAGEEAAWLGQATIGTEHLLLGLMRWQEGGAVGMLKALGIAPGRVRRSVRRMQQAARLEVSLEDARHMTGLSEIANRVLNGAIEEAARAGHVTVGVEHLLLVLCRDRRNRAGRVLRGLGIDPASVEGLVAQLAFPAPLAPVFDAAVSEASRLGDHYIGTDHLLWAITQDAGGVEVLRYLGLNPALVQSRLRELLTE